MMLAIRTPVMLMKRLASQCGPPVMLTMPAYRLRFPTSKASTTTVLLPMMLMHSVIGSDWAPHDADDSRFVV